MIQVFAFELMNSGDLSILCVGHLANGFTWVSPSILDLYFLLEVTSEFALQNTEKSNTGVVVTCRWVLKANGQLDMSGHMGTLN